MYTTHPLADFPWSISPQLGPCRCQKGRRLETSRRELSEDVSFGIGIFLGKPPQGGVIYTLYTEIFSYIRLSPPPLRSPGRTMKGLFERLRKGYSSQERPVTSPKQAFFFHLHIALTCSSGQYVAFSIGGTCRFDRSLSPE